MKISSVNHPNQSFGAEIVKTKPIKILYNYLNTELSNFARQEQNLKENEIKAFSALSKLRKLEDIINLLKFIEKDKKLHKFTMNIVPNTQNRQFNITCQKGWLFKTNIDKIENAGENIREIIPYSTNAIYSKESLKDKPLPEKIIAALYDFCSEKFGLPHILDNYSNVKNTWTNLFNHVNDTKKCKEITEQINNLTEYYGIKGLNQLLSKNRSQKISSKSLQDDLHKIENNLF